MSTRRNLSSWLPELTGPLDFEVNGAPSTAPKRSTVNLVGATVSDDEANDRTNITVGAALPPGSEGDIMRIVDGAPEFVPDLVELPNDSSAGDLFYFDGSLLQRIAAGDEGYVLTMVGGVPTWAPGGGGGTPDPALLSWAGWWRADYTNAAAWAGTASAGPSGGYSLDSGTRPSNGTAVNGKVPAKFNGSSQYLATQTGEAWISESQYSLSAYVKLVGYGSGGGSGTEYMWPGICQDIGGNWGLFVDASGVGLYHNDTASGTKAIRAGLALNTWALVTGIYDGTNIKLFIDGTQVASLAAIDLNPAHVSTVMDVGRSVGGYANIELLELTTKTTALSPTQISNLSAYCHARY